MFWISIAVLSFALMFTKLGALSVLVSVLNGALSFSLFVIVCLVVALLWRRFSTARSSKEIQL